ncbi:hypothetical protein BD311DRAFT_723604 [Dichomitus squalens]|uniref:Glycopeptide n=1 Tax=Dichomitus squalens TaxID=114155 RepID=A0A4Q9PQH5_9APHY|nr:hypothetical protein BD311DRAFT_723604 [Dichomitus squalens]TBU56609.1 hypothetical protein BD310DRAFT_931013 [Dichomitus squalens]
MQVTMLVSLIAFVASISSAVAETHTVHFINQCGAGTPTLVQDGNILSMGRDYVSDGPLISAIAYLQTGNCGLNGENCTTVETTLQNPTSPGNGSCTYINLYPPHTFRQAIGFGYYNGCDGLGSDCTSPNCPLSPGLPPIGGTPCVACQDDNVDLAITFCD